ncbi:hypothetical protein [Aurantiacibacter sediminis]|uniref:Uncharacterized protein n=1 Tax=Aurantiacibacter sediminis TaxID=2793064 RepID=A0ABS0N2F0_9SPHN|nr:hypothetical protein [Aurantiacibacter sediminis]MBH5322138.1 hypothetical protein [Aurantiacibacter sediminis]
MTLAAGDIAYAQDDQSSDSIDEDAIIVDGDLPEASEVSGAARRLTIGAIGLTSPIIRYYDPICLQVLGINTRFAEFVRARVIANAQEANMPIAEGDCEANAIIMVGQEPRVLYDALVDYNPRLVSPRSSSRVRREMADGEPAIVWHVLEPRDNEGINPLPVGWRTTVVPSRTRPSHVVAARLGVVILDADHLVGMDLERLSDYATMRLFAPRLIPNRYEIDEPRSIIYPFTPDTGETEMTRFDRAYLTALYSMQPQAPANRLPVAVARAFEADE